MKTISLSQLGYDIHFKKLPMEELKAMLPIEITVDGEVIAELDKRGKLSTKCPNCGLVYDATKPDDVPYFFSITHKGDS